MSIASFFSSHITKKRLSTLTLIVFVGNIFSPILAYAADPSMLVAETAQNIVAMPQISTVTVPRDLVVGDTLSITLSGSTKTQDFYMDTTTTLQLLNVKMNSLPFVVSSVDTATKVFTLTSEVSGESFSVSPLSITRFPIAPTITTPNIVAVAQEAEIYFEQDFIAGDTIAITVAGIQIAGTFSGSTDGTLIALADTIENMTSVHASYSGTVQKIFLVAKTPGNAFSVSNVVTTSSAIIPNPITVNVVPEAQIEQFTLSRPIHPDETVSLTISGVLYTQPYITSSDATMVALATQIDASDTLIAGFTGGILTITSQIPGLPYTIGDLTVTLGSIPNANLIPNDPAVAQVDLLALPRDLVAGDTIHATIESHTLTQTYSGSTEETLSLMNTQIDNLTEVNSVVNTGSRVFTITSSVAGVPFTLSGASLTTIIANAQIHANVIPEAKSMSLSFARDFVAGDTISVVLNGSTLTQAYTGSSASTFTEILNRMTNEMQNISATMGGVNTIVITSTVAGTDFSLSAATMVNSLNPTVLVQPIVPVKQKNAFQILPTLIAGDIINLTINGSGITQAFSGDESGTIIALDGLINGDTANNHVTSSFVGKTFSIESDTAGTSFSMSDVIITGSGWSSSQNTANVSETRANIELTVNSAPTDGTSIVVGDCIIHFSNIASDPDCSDGSADVDISSNNTSTVASLLRGIFGLSYDGGTVMITTGGTNNTAIYTRNSLQVGITQVAFTDISGVIDMIANTPQAAVAQQELISVPRDLVQGDSIEVVVDGVTVRENFTIDHTTTFTAFKNLLDALPSVDVTAFDSVARTIALTAHTPGVSFSVASGLITNTTHPDVSISNTVGVAQRDSVTFPAVFVAGDSVNINVNGTNVIENFASDNTTTWANLLGSLNTISGVSATQSGALELILDATNAGDPLSVGTVSITNSTTPSLIQANVAPETQIEELILPFTPSSGDTLQITVDGNSVSQAYTTDISTTLSLLNAQVGTLSGVLSSVDTSSGIFTLTAKTAGVGFTASLGIVGSTINPTHDTPNAPDVAQVEKFVIDRTFGSGDVLSTTIESHNLSQSFSGDTLGTIQSLSDQIDGLAEVGATMSGSDTIVITATTAGTAFAITPIQINASLPVTHIHPNVFAVAQVDEVTVSRNLVAGDVLSLNVNGTLITQTFTGSEDTTLDLFTSAIDAVAIVNASRVGKAITLTAATPGIAFSTGNLSLVNSIGSLNTQANVAPVAQVTEALLPTIIAGDTISFTINGSGITQSFITDEATTLIGLTSSIDGLGVVGSTILSGGILQITSMILGTEFIMSDISIVNTTNPSTIQVSNPAQAQVMTVTPADIIKGWTFRVNLNGTDYDYLSTPTDGVDEITDALAILMNADVNNTGALVSTGAGILTLTAKTPGMSFDLTASAQDITPPVVTLTGADQILKSGDISTSQVQSDENGTIYAALSGTTVDTFIDITNAITNHDAFIVESTAVAGLDYVATLPAGLQDGEYSFFAMDNYGNISTPITGWLTVDNTAPTLTIITPDNQTLNTDTFTLSGTTEPNIVVQITLSGQTINTVSLGDGTWSGTLNLPQDVLSTIVVTATDTVGNVSTDSISVTEDSNTPPLTFGVSTNVTALTSVVLSGSTDPNLAISITGGSGSVSVTAYGSGDFSTTIPLNLDVNNHLIVLVTDLAGNTASGTIDVLQDSTAPNVAISTLPQTVSTPSIMLDGMTEIGSTLVVTDGNGMVVGTGLALTGAFSIDSTLTPDTINILTVTATDPAGNTGSSSVAITQDSTPNILVISTPAQTLNADTLTITGTTKPNSILDITGGAATATGIADGTGLYSLVVNLTQDAPNALLVTSTDIVLNVSTGSVLIVEDSTPPVTIIDTPSQTTYNSTITLTGTTEPFASLMITGGSGSVGPVIASASGDFLVGVPLMLDSTNHLTVTATDLAGNTGSTSVDIIHDSVNIFLTLAVPDQMLDADTFTFTGTTKSGATVFFQVNTGSVSSITAPASGDFTGTVNLIQDTINTVYVAAQDTTLTFATGSFVITEDSTNPIISFITPSGTTVTTPNLVVQGTTEPLINLSIDNNGTITNGGLTSSTGAFSVTIPLNTNTLNTLVFTAIDGAGHIGTGSITVIQDNLGPVISGLSVGPFVLGGSMVANYTFTTNENTTATFLVGTGSNVLATLVATGSTSGTTHNSSISGLLANHDYYYVVDAVDGVGNTTTSPIGMINSIDTAGPVIANTTVDSLSSTGAHIAFDFTETHFDLPYATGSVMVTDSNGNILSFGTTFTTGIMSSGSADLNGLTPGMSYDFTINLADNFGNTTSTTGSFATTAIIVLTGGVVTETGSVDIIVDSSNTTNLNGTIITINSDPQDTGSLTGSLVLSGITSITSTPGWDGILFSPLLVPSNAPEAATSVDLTQLITALNNSTTTYTLGQIFQTVKVGGENVSITANGGYFQISFIVPSGAVGQTIRIYRSADGTSWQNNAPDVSCTLDAQKICTFNTDHLSYFTVASIVGNQIPVVSSGGGGGGGGGLRMDSCSGGDYSPSYYDGMCGTKPVSSTTDSGVVSDSDISETEVGTKKKNVTFTSEVDRIFPLNEVVSQEKIDAFVYSIQTRVFARTLDNASRVVTFSAMTRYLTTQIDTTTNESRKAVYAILKNRFNSIIVTLRQNIRNGVVIIPNKKKNNASNHMTILSMAADARMYRYVNTENILAVRMSPNFVSDTVGYLLMDQRVEVIGLGLNWSHIKAGTIDGYVRTRLLRKTMEVQNMSTQLTYRAIIQKEGENEEG